MALAAIAIAVGFWTIYLTGARRTGPEVFGKPIWWNSLRPVHGTLYGAFAIMALNPSTSKDAWKLLALDWVIGLGAFVKRHFLN